MFYNIIINSFKWLESVPWSALTDEDYGTHNNAGQGDAHANNDPRHRPLVYVVETIGEDWKINNRVSDGK